MIKFWNDRVVIFINFVDISKCGKPWQSHMEKIWNDGIRNNHQINVTNDQDFFMHFSCLVDNVYGPPFINLETAMTIKDTRITSPLHQGCFKKYIFLSKKSLRNPRCQFRKIFELKWSGFYGFGASSLEAGCNFQDFFFLFSTFSIVFRTKTFWVEKSRLFRWVIASLVFE